MFSLIGKTALVTGATGGIGASVAKALHAAGASVGISGTRAQVLEELKASLGGERVFVLPCNLSSPEDVEKLQEAFNECFNELLIDRDESTLQYAPGGEGYQKRADEEKIKQDDDVVITNSSSTANDESEDLKQEFTIEL